jgi:hypothetical protein
VVRTVGLELFRSNERGWSIRPPNPDHHGESITKENMTLLEIKSFIEWYFSVHATGKSYTLFGPGDDRNGNMGFTFKTLSKEGMNPIWKKLLPELNRRGVNWYQTAEYTEGPNGKPEPSKWFGIRSVPMTNYRKK